MEFVPSSVVTSLQQTPVDPPPSSEQSFERASSGATKAEHWMNGRQASLPGQLAWIVAFGSVPKDIGKNEFYAGFRWVWLYLDHQNWTKKSKIPSTVGHSDPQWPYSPAPVTCSPLSSTLRKKRNWNWLKIWLNNLDFKRCIVKAFWCPGHYSIFLPWWSTMFCLGLRGQQGMHCRPDPDNWREKHREHRAWDRWLFCRRCVWDIVHCRIQTHSFLWCDFHLHLF